jgi:toxin FitB
VAAWASSVPADVLLVSAITNLEMETGVLLVQRCDPSQGTLLRAWMD